MPTYDKDGNFYIGFETNAGEAAEQLRRLEQVLRECHTESKKMSDSETSSDRKELENKTKLYRQKDRQIRQEKELERQQRKNTDVERNRFSQNAKLLKQFAGIVGTAFAVKKIMDFGQGILSESRMLNASSFSYGLDPQRLKALGFLSKEFGGNDATAKQTLEHLKQIAYLVGKGQNPIGEMGMFLGGAGIFRDGENNLTQDPFIILSNLARRMRELEKQGQSDDARELGRAFGLNDSITSVLRKYGDEFRTQLQQQAETIALNKDIISEFQKTNRNIDEIKKIFENKLIENFSVLNKELVEPLAGWLAENPDVVKMLADILTVITGIGALKFGVEIGKWLVKTTAGEAITDTLADMIYTLSGEKKRDADAEEFLRYKNQKKYWDNLHKKALQEYKGEEDPFIADTLPKEKPIEYNYSMEEDPFIADTPTPTRSNIVSGKDHYKTWLDELYDELDLIRAVNKIAPMFSTPLNSMNSNMINNLGNSSNTSNSAVTRVGTINITAANSQPKEIAEAVERGLRISDFAMLDYMNSGGFRV